MGGGVDGDNDFLKGFLFDKEGLGGKGFLRDST
jgi:hypothetical protein